jgi:4-amino-4-deoxy-L-arabinose transferase-like glycosyltransferase
MGAARRLLLVAPALALCTLLVALRLPLLGAGQFDYDEGVYWASLRALAAGHPIYSSVFSSQPPAFLLTLEPIWAALGGSITAARSVMLGWGIVSVLSGAVIGGRLMGARGAVLMAALVASDPLMLRQSVVLQAEGPAIAFGLFGMALATMSVTTTRERAADLWAFGSGTALALGVLTKLLDVAVVPALVVLIAIHPQPVRRALVVAAGAVVASALVLVPLAGAWGPMWNQAVVLHLASRSVPLGQVTDPGFIAAALRELPLLALAATGVLMGRGPHNRPVVVGVLWVSGAVAAMALTHPLWPRHLVSLVPGAALLGAAGLMSVSARLRQGIAAPATALGVACLLSLAAVGLSSMTPAGGGEPLVAQLDRVASVRAVVLTDDQFAAASAGREVPPELVDTSFVRVESGGLSTSDIASVLHRDGVCAVVLATGRLRQVPGFTQWLQANYGEVIELGAGRVVYLRPGC